jgi:hypothetical protein
MALILFYNLSSSFFLRRRRWILMIPSLVCITSKPSSNMINELGRLFLYTIGPSSGPLYATSTITGFTSVTRPICPKSCPALPVIMIQYSPAQGCPSHPSRKRFRQLRWARSHLWSFPTLSSSDIECLVPALPRAWPVSRGRGVMLFFPDLFFLHVALP